jgi:hypothetical protein
LAPLSPLISLEIPELAEELIVPEVSLVGMEEEEAEDE